MTNSARPGVRFPFALKLGLAICLLSTVLVGSSLLFFYESTRTIVMQQMQNRLRAVGQTGTFLFDQQAREKIVSLRARLLTASAPRDGASWPPEPGAFEPSLAPSEVVEFHDDPAFRNLVQLLRRIKSGSAPRATQMRELPQIFPEGNQPAINFAYLLVPIPESPDHQILMTVADSDYQTIDSNENNEIEPEEEGNPAGSLYWIPSPIFSRPFEDGMAHVAEDWYTDQWGTFMTAAVPIIDANDEVIAVMGLDLLVQSQANRLRELRRNSVAILAGGLLVSIVISMLLARYLANPVRKLMRGALRVKERDFSTQVEIRNQDELGVLAWAFNDMVDELSDYSSNLEDLVNQRTAELEEANDTIRRINQNLTVENLRLGAEVKVARKLQMMVLPSQRELNLVRGLEIVGYMDPADEVGGDYYDVLLTDGGYAKIGIGDVCGHGLESGVVMLMVQTAVRTALFCGVDQPERFYSVINRVIFRNLKRIQSDKSMTLSLLDYFADGRLVITGQHEEMILVRANGELQQLDTLELGVPIGLDEHVDEFVSSTEIRLKENDVVLLHTDGITEAENEHGEQFGMPRLLELARKVHRQSVGQIMRIIREELRAFIGSRQVLDDITLVVLKKR